MNFSQFSRKVILPAFLPFFLIGLVRSFTPSPSLSIITSVLVIASAVLYLKRLIEHWGKTRDFAAEARRFRLLVWLLPLLFLLNALLNLEILTGAPHPVLLWASLLAGGVALTLLLTIFLQLFRLSPGLIAKRVKLGIGLLIALAVFVANWPGQLEFVVWFLAGFWLFTFEECAKLSSREKLTLTLFSFLGLVFLSAVSFESPIVFKVGGAGSAAQASSIADTLDLVSPLFRDLLGGLKRILLALFIVFPIKVQLRPVADWFKFSLRIRTKLLLSYVLSGIIPGFLLVLLFSVGVLFLLGGYWQKLVSQLVTSRAKTMLVLLPPGSPPWQKEVEDRFSSELRVKGVSAMVFSYSKGRELVWKHYEGEKLPVSLRGDTLAADLGAENFSGLLTVNDTLLYLTSWTKLGNSVIGLVRPFTFSDLLQMKDECKGDLTVFSGLDLQVTPVTMGGTTLELSPEDVRKQVSTRKTSLVWKLPDFPLRFPVVSPSIGWDERGKPERSNSVFLVETTLFSTLKNVLSTEQVVNRVYLVVFAMLAIFLGGILVLVALVGFGLAGAITRSIGSLRRGTQQLRSGDLGVNIYVKSRDELGELAESFNLMVADLRRMIKDVREKERLESELETARTIQLRLLPERAPEVPGFEIAASFLPAKQVGGDYYDFLKLSEGSYGFAIGDVSGKGMPAALLMANLQASLHALVESYETPGELVSRLNRALHSNTAPQMFATFFYGILDPSSNRLSYANAGHNHPIVCGNGRIVHLTEGGVVLGVVPDFMYREGEIVLSPGEVVALYSDGITEARDAVGKEFGEERLVELLERKRSDTAKMILKSVLEDVEKFCGTPQDDITLVLIKRK